MKIKIDENARYIIDKLYEAGFEAYVVGGCVRDSLLGKSPKDWDITTSASPNQVKKILSLLNNEEDRELIVYHVILEYKFKEISMITNKPLGTVLWQYNKAIKNNTELNYNDVVNNANIEANTNVETQTEEKKPRNCGAFFYGPISTYAPILAL